MDKYDLLQRTKIFAHRCVKTATSLPSHALGKHIQYQLIRCSTSVAANYRAACIAQSKPSFISKLGTVIEEVDETNFWLEFIIDEDLLANEEIFHILKESAELTSIFIASRKTAQIKK
jgi:four helix bundle protein